MKVSVSTDTDTDMSCGESKVAETRQHEKEQQQHLGYEDEEEEEEAVNCFYFQTEEISSLRDHRAVINGKDERALERAAAFTEDDVNYIMDVRTFVLTTQKVRSA